MPAVGSTTAISERGYARYALTWWSNCADPQVMHTCTIAPRLLWSDSDLEGKRAQRQPFLVRTRKRFRCTIDRYAGTPRSPVLSVERLRAIGVVADGSLLLMGVTRVPIGRRTMLTTGGAPEQQHLMRGRTVHTASTYLAQTKKGPR